jgi:uncharacterized protein
MGWLYLFGMDTKLTKDDDNLDQFRLDKHEKKALRYALENISNDVFIFGSRLDLAKKGGDIDLLIFSSDNGLSLSQLVSRRFFEKCEEKIDVIVMNPDQLNNEQQAFINTLTMEKIK